MTSYQKLKLENKKLKEDIYKIIDNDIEIMTQYILRKSVEKMVWFGTPTINKKENYGNII